MKRLALALTLIMALLFTGVFAVQLAQSNIMPYTPPQITVLSPILKETYHSSSVPLNVKVQIFGQTPQSLEHLDSLNYSLDGQEDVPIPFVYPSSYGPGYYLTGNSTLSGVADGIHSLIVRGETTIGAENKDFNATVTFTVDTTTTPIAESFPTTLVIAASGVSLAVVAAALLVYFKKNKHKAEVS